ncbi:protein kinase domain-containing protein [Mastigocoleus testarum]|uniref:non-specific serine/threonine protein kinase n=1 Tax=Mastigocoleus testarum BC008 TaxID=371196 RepID=A0A0V7ZV67_9CYAN|nr:DUF4062 domain-containing protein [Mastigocoleus testarum]KST67967.1 hypothetical protein BC008_31750 [Mastigocoleus testarum BC008]KST68408.1 hypothetical protein BC008_33375 [Mastigocoleus testarum BC008]
MFQDQIGTFKNLRIFVSSTFQDLHKHKTAILNSINSLVSFSDDEFYWPKDEYYSHGNFTDRVKKADLLIIIIAHKYGYIPKDMEYSAIEVVYNTAVKNNIPILPFIIDDSYAWPPALFDFEHREKLKKFKARIKEAQSVKIFSSPDNLAGLVTEAIVDFVNKHTGIKLIKFPDYVSLKEISLHTEITQLPDINILLGRAEDKLLFLLEINRSNGLNNFYDKLHISKPDLTVEFPDAIFNELLVSLSKQKRIYTVHMKNGQSEELFVSQNNLSNLFESLFFRIVDSCSLSNKRIKTRSSLISESDSTLYQEEELYDRDIITNPEVIDKVNKAEKVEEYGNLESVGGLNRFLGISLNDNKLYSVGKQNGKWVEWHPFILESLEVNLPDVFFKPSINSIADPLEINLPKSHFKSALSIEDKNITIKPISFLEEYLTYNAMEYFSDYGEFVKEIDFYLARQSVGNLFLKIAQSIEDYHKQKVLVHADIKPSNILLSSDGPIIIDGFDIAEGEIAPGWTPNWSAPEVIMGDPISFKSDVYSLARIMTDITGGYLLGEVRKLMIPGFYGSYNTEIDVFYNPIVHIPLRRHTLNKEGTIEWKQFLQSCLRFDPNERLDMSKFLSTLEKLLSSYPLRNRIKFQLKSKIFAATLPNGNHVVTRVISDIFEQNKPESSKTVTNQTHVPLDIPTTVDPFNY